MDVSDGLLKDFDRLAAHPVREDVSRRRACRCRRAARAVVAAPATIADLMTGGEDYEVLAANTAQRRRDERAAAAAGIAVTRIGGIAAAPRASRPSMRPGRKWSSRGRAGTTSVPATRVELSHQCDQMAPRCNACCGLAKWRRSGVFVWPYRTG
jgi:thiamine monophosphate kinase